MRCQASIWRWSPFLGICVSKFTGARGWTMYGAKPFSSTLMRRALSASQCASSPSPSEVARPMPVIQTSVDPALGDFVSVIGDGLLREADTFGHDFHMSAQICIREGDVAERERCVAPQFAADADLRRGNGKTRTFMHDAGIDFQRFPGGNKSPHLG